MMSTLKVSDEMEFRLTAVIEPLEVVNAQGKVLGRFIPAEGIEPFFEPLSAKELQSIMSEPRDGWPTTAQVLAEARKLTCSE